MFNEDRDDLIPRSPPKPTQVDVPRIVIRPEVPDVSLINYSVADSKNLTPPYDKKKSQTDSNRLYNFIDDEVSSKCNQINSNLAKFNHSPPKCETTRNNNCLRNYSDSDTNSVNNCKSLKSKMYEDMLKHAHNIQKCENQELNAAISENQCSNIKKQQCYCTICVNEYNHFLPRNSNSCDHIFRNAEPNFNSAVSPTDLQTAVLKFENSFLKLNYKCSKIAENYVSKDELKIIFQKYENQIELLQRQVDELTNKLHNSSSNENSNCSLKCVFMKEKSDKNNIHPSSIQENATEGTKCYLKCPCKSKETFKNKFSPCNYSSKDKEPNIIQNSPSKRVSVNAHPTSDFNHHRKDDEVNVINNTTSKYVCVSAHPTCDSNYQNVCYSTRKDEEINNAVKNNPSKYVYVNTDPTNDLSYHMRALTMKYMSNNRDEFENVGKKSPVDDIIARNNGNNISVATLQYMERYQLLSTGEHNKKSKSADFHEYKQDILSGHCCKFREQNQNNNSFINVEKLMNSGMPTEQR